MKFLAKFLAKFLVKFLEKLLEKFLAKFLAKFLVKFLAKFLEKFLEKLLEKFLEKLLEKFLEKFLEKLLAKFLARFVESASNMRPAAIPWAFPVENFAMWARRSATSTVNSLRKAPSRPRSRAYSSHNRRKSDLRTPRLRQHSKRDATDPAASCCPSHSQTAPRS